LIDDGLRDWEFHLVGSVDVGAAHQAYFEQVRQAARGYPIRLHLDASLAELQALYGAAKIYWHASGYGEDVRRDPIKFEHFGTTTVEAMAAGAVPIVIGQAGQLEVVEHERSGLRWHTLEELAAQTRRVIDDQALCFRLSAGAIERSRAFSRAAFDRRVRQLIDMTTSAPS
jgi:glycosyltransferase involved in cell wall biosynthesis